jgi:Fur family transcriptional regulator, ferric uptake regulator
LRLTANKIAGILRQNGYRLTHQRHAVLKAIADSHDHLTPAEIYAKVRQEDPSVGLATIYRVINLLAELDLICRVNLGGDSPGYLMKRSEAHHHHLVCSRCGKAVDFTNCDLSQLEQQLSRDTDFRIEGHILEVYGRCPECRAETTS